MTQFTVITENDISNWNDEKGVKYHFPKRYLKYLDPGTKIIYYKGKIKDKQYENMRLSKDPHYFGIGTIGDVWQESERSSNYYAEIIDYIEFKDAISFKAPNGNYREQIPESRKSNFWRDGVRSVNESFYESIRQLAGLDHYAPTTDSNTKVYNTPEITSTDLLKTYEQKSLLVKDGSNKARYSKEAKKIGDLGEGLVFEYLKNQDGVRDLVWHANIGETPGYDISYLNQQGEKICIEVKSTSAKSFLNFIMTTNEVECAKKIGKNYKIYLVADCFSEKPQMNVINNPTEDSTCKFETLAYKVYKKS